MPAKSAKNKTHGDPVSIVVPRPTRARFYGHGIPGVDLERLPGKLIVLEGADGSGRSTQIRLLVEWLEGCGHATVQVGLSRSMLVREELEKAKQSNILSHTTMSLFYATDFADQLENVIIPALKAGYMVLADRYIYTLMARDLVRGADLKWLQNLYGFALVPDVVFYLHISPQALVQRAIVKHNSLDYWESGMDLGLSRDMFDSFLEYQRRCHIEYERLQAVYGFKDVDAQRAITETTEELKRGITAVLEGRAT